MAYSQETRNAVRKSYIDQGKNLEQIALSLGVPLRTVSRWKNEAAATGDDWDMVRTAHTLSEQGASAVFKRVLENFVLAADITMKQLNEEQMSAIDRAATLSRLSDSCTKVTAAAGKFLPDVNQLAIAMDVLHDFGAHIMKNFPEQSELFLVALEQFGPHLSKKFR